MRTIGAVGSGAALGVGGWRFAGRPADLVDVNVGYAEEGGLGAAVTAAFDVLRRFSFDALALRLPRRAAGRLAERDDIRYVETNRRLGLSRSARVRSSVLRSQTDPEGVERVNAGAAHERGVTGDGASIAVLDTGIESDHPDLQANLGDGASFVEGDEEVVVDEADDDRPVWEDDYGHGTHCAGVAGAVDNDLGVRGVAPEATVHALKIGTDSFAGSADIAAAIEFVGDNEIDVANLSLGGGKRVDVVADACQYANEAGVMLVGAAGNVEDADTEPIVDRPAAYDEVIAVGATTDDGEPAGFSAIGPEVELLAPGEEVLSTAPDDDYERRSGTSMAAPHVSGAGALLMAEGYSNVEARERLCETAADIGHEEAKQGHGIVDVAAAFDLDP